MPSPKILELEPFLASLTLQTPPHAPDYDLEVIVHAGQATGVDKSGRAINEATPELRVWYKSVGGFGINSLLSIVESNLRKKHHSSNKRIALAVIGLYLILRQPNEFSANFFFDVLENTVAASATLYYIFPRFMYVGKGTKVSPFQFGPYSFGELDLAQLKRLCKKAKSDYYNRYEAHLQRRFAIQREFPEVIVINWWPYREQRTIAFSMVAPLAKLFNELVENYFDQLNHALFGRFFGGIFEEQYLTVAIGDTYLDEKPLEMLPLTDRIAIFQNTDGKHENGFVKPLGSAGYALDFAAVDTHLPKALDYLQSEFNFVQLADCQIHQTIKTFAQFVSKAKKHKWSGYLDDAFLHFIIALDVVFGETEQSTDSVSRRVAVLTYQKSMVDYKEQVKRIRKLYGERSKYVHEGKSVGKESLDMAEAICNEVLLCLLRLQKDEQQRAEISIENWIKHVDLVAATLEADRIPNHDLLTECGVLLE